MDSTLSIKNASGKTFSLLNENTSSSTMLTPFKVNKLTSSLTAPVPPKRKYHCMEPGCNKSFTTSGHLARHNRIHTGEKNFHCLHPGCPSRFSRQDNMMQHYRTHLSQKARRNTTHTSRASVQSKKSNHRAGTIEEKPDYFLHHHFHERMLFLQPSTRQRRSSTMPSLPRPEMMNRPKRALSTSSRFENESIPVILPPPIMTNPPPQQQQEWKPNSQKHHTRLSHLTNIVSSFG